MYFPGPNRIIPDRRNYKMLNRLQDLYALGNGDHLNIYEALRLKIVNRLAVLCIVLDLMLMVLNLAIANYIGLVIDVVALFTILIPVLYLNYIQRYQWALYLFIAGYHLAVFLGSIQTLYEGRINEIELLLIPGAIGLSIVLSGRKKIILFLINFVGLAILKYMRWDMMDLPMNDYYKMLAMIVIIFAAIYFFISEFKYQLISSLKSTEFLNQALISHEKELEESNNAKDRLFSIIAHDLRSPLDLIQGLLDPTVLNQLEKEELIKYQTGIRSRIGALQETMSNLLNWAQSQLGKIEVKPIQVFVVQESQFIFDFFEEMITSKNISIEIQNDSIASAWLDKDHFNVIMRNIIHNAIKFTPTNGKITFTTFLEKDKIVIIITDTGVGMSDEAKIKILKNELVTPNQGTSGEKGSGVGLSFSYELVKKNKGELIIDTPAEGGTSISISFPVA